MQSEEDGMNLPDFDELVALAQSNPAELERLRREMIEEVIASASNERTQRRLRGLQFRIDATIRLSRTPMAACLTISRMMHDSFMELRESLLNDTPPNARGDSPDSAPGVVVNLADVRAQGAARRAH